MANILPSKYIGAIIVFVFFISSALYLFTIAKDSGAAGIDDTKLYLYNKTFSKQNDIIDLSNDIKANIEQATVDFGNFGMLNGLISAAWNTLRLLFTSLSFASTMIAAMPTYLGLPSYVGGLAVAFITLMLGFAIYSAIFQREI